MPIANSKHLKSSVERPHTAEHYYVHDPFIDDSEHPLDECTHFAPLPIRTRPALLKYLHKVPHASPPPEDRTYGTVQPPEHYGGGLRNPGSATRYGGDPREVHKVVGLYLLLYIPLL
jgi:hypothetical protein